LDGTILVKSGVVALFCDESSDDEFSSLIFSSELTLFSYDDTIEYYYEIVLTFLIPPLIDHLCKVSLTAFKQAFRGFL
jgi:hypothetical protein